MGMNPVLYEAPQSARIIMLRAYLWFLGSGMFSLIQLGLLGVGCRPDELFQPKTV